MYFVVAVLVPLQTLVARMCSVANENVVLPQMLIGQGFCLNVRPSVSMHTSRPLKEVWFVDCSVIMSAY